MKLRNTILTMLLPLPLLLGGCGSASNDQGVSFTLVGFGAYDIDETTQRVTCLTDEFTNLITVPLSDSAESTPNTIFSCLVVQHSMPAVTVRTEVVNLSYHIAGASIQPPSTTTRGTVVLPSANTSGSTGTTGGTSGTSGTSGTGGITSFVSKASIPVNIVPPSIREWLSLNRNSLPAAPYSMDIIVSVTGVTSAGDQLTTNEAYLQSTVIQDVTIDPAPEPTPAG